MSNYYIPNERLNLIPEKQIAHYLVTFKAGEDEAIEIRSTSDGRRHQHTFGKNIQGHPIEVRLSPNEL